jgi:hypothetical protein
MMSAALMSLVIRFGDSRLHVDAGREDAALRIDMEDRALASKPVP